MSNNKQSSIDWLIDKLHLKDSLKWEEVIEQAKAMNNEEVKNSCISGYLDNGYYEGAEEDASKLWEETYGFAHNETFGE